MRGAFSTLFMIGMLACELVVLATLVSGCVGVPTATRYHNGDHGDFVLNLA